MPFIRTLFCVLCTLFCHRIVAADAPTKKPTIYMGVLAYAPPWIDGSFMTETMHHLAWQLPQYQFQAQFYSSEDLTEAIRQGDIDVIALTASQYRALAHLGIRDLVTLVSRKNSANHGAAGAFIVRRDRSDIQSLEDLKGLHVATTQNRLSTGRFETSALIAQQYNRTLRQYFSHVTRYPELRMRKIIEDVIAGKADVGILRACFLEDLQSIARVQYLKKVKVVAPQDNASLHCKHSTPTHPGWVIATTANLSPEVATALTSALLGKAPNSWGQSWSVASDFTLTDQMLKTLKLGPYQYLRDWTLARIWQEYQLVIVICIFALLGLFSHVFILQKQVQRRTLELKETHERERQALEKAHAASTHLDRLQRAGVVGQMSSIVAHEMKQPLAVIQNLCRGVERHLEDEDDLDPETIVQAIRNIELEANRAATIVNRVRALAKGQSVQREKFDFGSLIREIIQEIQLSKRTSVQIDLHVEQTAEVRIHKVDLFLIVLNLLSNAIDATKEVAQPKIDVFVTRHDHYVQLTVRDNGPELSDESVENLGQNILYSSKENGLGLGVSIIKTLVESYVGKLTYKKAEPHGLLAIVRLPIHINEPRNPS